MRSEESPLDLNNLPEDYTKDTSSYAGGGKEGKEECGKVYECRFCSLKFCKSQALGGHMNRHRQERETETLNKARHLVFSNDNPLLPQPPHLGCQGIPQGGYHRNYNGGDPTTLQAFRSIYPTTRLFAGSSSSSTIQPPPSNHHPSPTRLVPFPPPTTTNDYFLGHVFPAAAGNNNPQQEISNNYTCIGAPVVGNEEGGGLISSWGNQSY